MNKVKFVFISFLILILTFFILIIYLLSTSKEKEINNMKNDIIETSKNEVDKIKNSDRKKFNIINVDIYLELLKKDEISILLIGRSSCEYCHIAEPILQNISKEYDLNINYLSTDNFSEEDKIKFLNSSDYFKERKGIATPTLIILKNNKYINLVEGLNTKDGYIEFFKSNEIIK